MSVTKRKLHDFHAMDPASRRTFLKALGIALAAPHVPAGLRFAVNELLVSTAYAQSVEGSLPSYFIEINMRDQFDFGHAFVAPGIATASDMVRGASGTQVALFDDPNTLKKVGNNFYLTNESKGEIEEHLESIAVMELCELALGTIHNHEAANCIRSPGRSYNGGAGRSEMWLLDPHENQGGNENHYSAVPTPAVLHNYAQKQLSMGLRNGVNYKGVHRAIHTVYHHSAGLVNAQLDRYNSTDAILNAFNSVNVAPPAPTGILAKHSTTISRLVKMVDEKHLETLSFGTGAKADHEVQIQGAGQKLQAKSSAAGAPKAFSLALTDQEKAYWRNGVSQAGHEGPKANFWEQVGWASKLITNDIVRTVAIEYCFTDIHGPRSEADLRAQGTQIARPLARLIKSLKDAGIYDRTTIVIYTLDGGRSPAADSWGSEGKNGFILAGGKVKGGYYGDLKVASRNGDAHTFSYHMPDLTSGLAIANGTTGNDRRVSGASAWKTVMKAAGISSQLMSKFPDTNAGQPLDFMLKA